MSKVFNMVGGGGGKNISSIIITGSESTDTVTCTKDGKSYPATWDETSQHWEIVGLPLGTFTITATNGTKTITETVLIDIVGVYELEIDYRTWLYYGPDNGNEYIDATGGWVARWGSQSNSGYGEFVKNNSSIYIKCNHYSLNYAENGCGPNNMIDLTNYKTLKCEFLTLTGFTILGICKATSWSAEYDILYNPIVAGSEAGIYSFDISEYTGSYYIIVACGTGGNISATFDKVWLE